MVYLRPSAKLLPLWKKKKNVKKRKKSWKNTSGGVDAGELRPAHPSRRHRRPPRTSAGSRLHRGGRFRATHRIHEVSLCSPFFTSNRWHYLIIHPNCWCVNWFHSIGASRLRITRGSTAILDAGKVATHGAHCACNLGDWALRNPTA
jgi:hypothetical protein